MQHDHDSGNWANFIHQHKRVTATSARGWHKYSAQRRDKDVFVQKATFASVEVEAIFV